MPAKFIRGSVKQDGATIVLKSGATEQLTITHPANNTAARVLTLPDQDAAYTLISRDSTDTGSNRIQNKELSDNNVLFVDSADTTKKLAFQISGITTGNTRTWTIPDSSDTIVGKSTTDVLTNKSLDSDNNTITNIVNADIKAAAAIAVNKIAAVTASRAVVSDGSGFVSAATTTATEIGYVNGVTSAIQTQLGAITGTTLTAGNGLSGGGDLSANRSFALDYNELSAITPAVGDLVSLADIDDRK